MSERNGSTRRWRNVRARVLRASTVCALCGRDGADSVDHKMPIARGGDRYDPANLQPAHSACNRAKSDKLDYAGPPVRPSRNW